MNQRLDLHLSNTKTRNLFIFPYNSVLINKLKVRVITEQNEYIYFPIIDSFKIKIKRKFNLIK